MTGSLVVPISLTFMIVGLVSAGTFLLASSLSGPTLSVGLLIFVGVSPGMNNSNVWSMTQALAGPQASGRWTELQCAFGNLSLLSLLRLPVSS
jgi:ACS family D-galactonate transporter-like MFS transporter